MHKHIESSEQHLL